MARRFVRKTPGATVPPAPGRAEQATPAVQNGSNGDGGHGGDDVRRIFEPPRGFGVDALRRNLLIVLFCGVVGVVFGIGLGSSKAPTYSATATLQVGQVNPNSPGFFSYVQSASSLATAFSRSIEAAPVLAGVEHRTGLAPRTSAGRLEAAPIPLSPAFKIVATGPTEIGAIKLANASAAAVVRYVGKSNNANPAARALLAEYGDASLKLKQAEQKQAEAAPGDGQERQAAEAGVETAQIRVNAIGKAYVGSITSQAPRQGLVSLLAGATIASSDHKSRLEMWGLIGALAGIVFGSVLALLRERRAGRRRAAPIRSGPDAAGADA